MELDLPPEIIQEILVHLRDDFPSDIDIPLKNLRIAFACRAFYRDLAPLVEAHQLNLLRTEMQSWRLSLLDAGGAYLSQGLVNIKEGQDSASPTRISEMRFKVYLFERTEAIWSLHSFLSRGDLVARLARFKLTLEINTWRYLCEDRPGTEAKKWRSALLKLVELILSQEGLQFEFEGETSWITSDLRASSERWSPQDALRDSKCRLSSLTLSGNISALSLIPIAHSYLRFICSQSRSSLTHLHLNFPKGASKKWNDMVQLFKFNRLCHLSISDLTMPPKLLAAIVEQNPTITSMSISEEHATNLLFLQLPWENLPSSGQPARVLNSSAPSRYTLSNIRSLTCNPLVLVALLNTSFSFPNLETLILCGYTRGITAALAQLGQDENPGSVKPLSLIIELPYESSIELAPWFASARLSAGEYIKETAFVKAFKGLAASATTSPSSSPRAKNYHPMSLAVALRRLHNVQSLTIVTRKLSRRDPLQRGEGTHRNSPPLKLSPKLVARFIAALPAVKDVTLHSIFHDLKTGQGDEGSDDIRKEMEKVWKMSTTVEEITFYDYGHGELSRQTEVLVRP